MDDDQKMIVVESIIIFVGIILFVSTIFYGAYLMKLANYENFQSTIKDLNDEQKCLHICGFQYPGSALFDNYKFCVEKCDRISERAANTEACSG